ncbi:MAG: hypothetical protein KAX65_15920, partial [Caldilineaceae bacterium]|nr:hypothetical protein [Caldilineaceae bacterium]
NSECCESAKSGALTVSLLFYTMRFQIVNSYRSGIRRNQSNILMASSTSQRALPAMLANMTASTRFPMSVFPIQLVYPFNRCTWRPYGKVQE